MDGAETLEDYDNTLRIFQSVRGGKSGHDAMDQLLLDFEFQAWCILLKNSKVKGRSEST